MVKIRIDTQQVRDASRRFANKSYDLDSINQELQYAIDGLDICAWDGRSRVQAEPLLEQVYPSSSRLAQELERLSQMLRRVADTFEDRDQTVAHTLDKLPWVEWTERVHAAVEATIGTWLGIFRGGKPRTWDEKEQLKYELEKGTIGYEQIKHLFELYEIEDFEGQWDTLHEYCGTNSVCLRDGANFVINVQAGTIGSSYASSPVQIGKGGINVGVMGIVGNIISFGTHKNGNLVGASHSLIGVKPGVFVESVGEGPVFTSAAEAYKSSRENGGYINLQEVYGITETQRRDAAKFAMSQVKTEDKWDYDWFGTAFGIQSDNKWYCSELAYKSLDQVDGVNIQLGEDVTPSNYLFNGISSPVKYVTNGLFEFRWGDWIDEHRYSPHELETAIGNGRSLIRTY